MFIAKKFILVMLSVFAFVACSPDVYDDEKTIKIGVMLSLTGDAAQVSNDIKNAILEMNKKYADKNIKTQLIIEDTSGDTKKVLAVANKLIYIDKVDVIITTISSNAILVSPLAHKEGILHFGTVDNANKEVNTTTFTHWTTPEQKAKKLVELLNNDNAKNVAIVIQNIETQKTLSMAVEKEIQKHKLDSQTYYFNSNNLDFRTDLLKIKNKNYDKIVLLMFSPMIDEHMYFVVGPNNPLYGTTAATMQELLQFPFLTRRNMMNQFNENMLRRYNKNLDIIQIHIQAMMQIF